MEIPGLPNNTTGNLKQNRSSVEPLRTMQQTKELQSQTWVKEPEPVEIGFDVPAEGQAFVKLILSYEYQQSKCM